MVWFLLTCLWWVHETDMPEQTSPCGWETQHLGEKKTGFFYLVCLSMSACSSLTARRAACASAPAPGSGCTSTGPRGWAGRSGGCCRRSAGLRRKATAPRTPGLWGRHNVPPRSDFKSHTVLSLSEKLGLCCDSLFSVGKSLYPKKQFHSSPTWACLQLSGTSPPQYLHKQHKPLIHPSCTSCLYLQSFTIWVQSKSKIIPNSNK